jgi:hypothetical protein
LLECKIFLQEYEKEKKGNSFKIEKKLTITLFNITIFLLFIFSQVRTHVVFGTASIS